VTALVLVTWTRYSSPRRVARHLDAYLDRA
jgi:hypothetical protein